MIVSPPMSHMAWPLSCGMYTLDRMKFAVILICYDLYFSIACLWNHARGDLTHLLPIFLSRLSPSRRFPPRSQQIFPPVRHEPPRLSVLLLLDVDRVDVSLGLPMPIHAAFLRDRPPIPRVGGKLDGVVARVGVDLLQARPQRALDIGGVRLAVRDVLDARQLVKAGVKRRLGCRCWRLGARSWRNHSGRSVGRAAAAVANPMMALACKTERGLGLRSVGAAAAMVPTEGSDGSGGRKEMMSLSVVFALESAPSNGRSKEAGSFVYRSWCGRRRMGLMRPRPCLALRWALR